MLARHFLLAAAIGVLAPSAVTAQVWQSPGPVGTPPATAAMSATVPWPVPNRSFERGEILTEQDFSTQQLSARSVPGLLPLESLVGKAASRMIPAGSALRQSDVMEPQLVYRGGPVKLHVRIDGIDIASSGRALGDGQLGRTVRVFSNVSSRTVDAIVIGPGVVQLAGL